MREARQGILVKNMMNAEYREGNTEDHEKGTNLCCRGQHSLPKSVIPTKPRFPAGDKTPGFMKKLLPGEELPQGSASRAIQRENEDELREAVENFRAYLSILRKWDEKENVKIRGILTTEARNLN